MSDSAQHASVKGFHIVGASTYAIGTAFIQAMDLPTDVKFEDEILEEITNRDRVTPMGERIMTSNTAAIELLALAPACTIICLVEEDRHAPFVKARFVTGGLPPNVPTLSHSMWVQDVAWINPHPRHHKLARFVCLNQPQKGFTSVILDVTKVKIIEL